MYGENGEYGVALAPGWKGSIIFGGKVGELKRGAYCVGDVGESA